MHRSIQFEANGEMNFWLLLKFSNILYFHEGTRSINKKIHNLIISSSDASLIYMQLVKFSSLFPPLFFSFWSLIINPN